MKCGGRIKVWAVDDREVRRRMGLTASPEYRALLERSSKPPYIQIQVEPDEAYGPEFRFCRSIEQAEQLVEHLLAAIKDARSFEPEGGAK